MGSDNSSEILQNQINEERRSHERMLKEFKEDQAKREKEQNERFQEMMKSHNARLEELREEAKEREKKYDEERKLEQQRNKELLEKIENEKNEEKKIIIMKYPKKMKKFKKSMINY